MNLPTWAFSPVLFAAALAVGAASLHPPTRPGPAGKPPAAAQIPAFPKEQLYNLLPHSVAGDELYATVSSDWILDFYLEFRKELFAKGVTKWDERFDCNHFAGYFVELAQTKFYLDNFQSRSAAQTLALGMYWYRQDSAPTSHAVVVAITEIGVRFFDPQTGKFIVLSPAERASAFLVVF